MTRIFLLICWLITHVATIAQDRQQVDKWNSEGMGFVHKGGEAEADLNAAEKLGNQSMALSRRLQYADGFNKSAVLLAMVGIERGTATTAHALMNIVDDSTKAAILLQLNTYYHHGGQLPQNSDSAAWCLQRAMKIALSLKNPTLEFQARTALFVQYCEENRSGPMMEQIKHIERLGPGLETGHMIQFYVSSTEALLKAGDYSLILKLSLSGLKLSEKQNPVWGAFFHHMLGRTYRQMKEYGKSTDAFRKAIDLYKASGMIPVVWNNSDAVVKNLLDIHRPEEALQQTYNTVAAGFSGIRDSIVYYKMLGLCYKAMNDYERAVEVYEIVARLSERTSGEDFSSYLQLGMIYQRTKQYDKAAYYLRRMLNIKNLPLSYKATAHAVLFRVDTAMKDYTSAINNLLRYQVLNDSMRNKDKENTVRLLLTQFETEKKDKDLVLQRQSIDLLKKQSALREKDLENAELEFDYQMNERERNLQLAKMEAASKDKNLQLYSQNINLLKKDALLQQATISRNVFTRNMLIAGSALMLTILLLLYSRYRLKQRNAYQLAEKNLRLETLVTEKELLVKEVHHRVKNNLQTIISLLESQASFLSNDALAELQKSQGRVYAMSLIHHKLYQQDDITTVKMDAYFHELLTHIKSSFDLPKNIQVQEAIEPLELVVSQAIPLGLILNEAITNAIKYAFPGNRPGLISVSLQEMSDHQLQLQVEDNGVGLPQDWDQLPRKSLGFTLMRGLCGDIHGEFRISSSGGTCIDVSFPKTLRFLSN